MVFGPRNVISQFEGQVQKEFPSVLAMWLALAFGLRAPHCLEMTLRELSGGSLRRMTLGGRAEPFKHRTQSASNLNSNRGRLHSKQTNRCPQSLLALPSRSELIRDMCEQKTCLFGSFWSTQECSEEALHFRRLCQRECLH